MSHILKPTEEPYGRNCADCPLFEDSSCLGVSTVRVVIGKALEIEKSLVEGHSVDVRSMSQSAVERSFRILQRTLDLCQGPGNDGRGDFRKSEDSFSGYIACAVINTAMAQVPIPPTTERRLSVNASSSMTSRTDEPSMEEVKRV
jgi:hypothetical protein